MRTLPGGESNEPPRTKFYLPMFQNYTRNGCFDEMLDETGHTRMHYNQFAALFGSLTPEEFEHRRQSVDLSFLRQGITFNVYGDARGTEKIFPFDLVPRIIPASEWEYLERGLATRQAFRAVASRARERSAQPRPAIAPRLPDSPSPGGSAFTGATEWKLASYQRGSDSDAYIAGSAQAF
jgi:hypothetical protein